MVDWHVVAIVSRHSGSHSACDSNISIRNRTRNTNEAYMHVKPGSRTPKGGVVPAFSTEPAYAVIASHILLRPPLQRRCTVRLCLLQPALSR